MKSVFQENSIKSFEGVSKIFQWSFVLQFCCSINLIAATKTEEGLVSVCLNTHSPASNIVKGHYEWSVTSGPSVSPHSVSFSNTHIEREMISLPRIPKKDNMNKFILLIESPLHWYLIYELGRPLTKLGCQIPFFHNTSSVGELVTQNSILL